MNQRAVGGPRLPCRNSQSARADRDKLRREGRSTVTSSAAVPPDNGQFTKHRESVPEDANFRTRLITPVHWHFRNAIAPLLGQVEELKIESKSINRCIPEKLLCDDPTEQLESALGVGDPSDAALLHRGIKQGAQQASIEARVDGEIR